MQKIGVFRCKFYSPNFACVKNDKYQVWPWCTLLTWLTLLTLPIMSYKFIQVFNGITLPEVLPLVLKRTGWGH